MSGRAAFRKADLDRALRVLKAHGLPVHGIEVNDNGFRILSGDDEQPKRRKNKADELYGPQT